MADPMEELRATAARLKCESEELMRKVDAIRHTGARSLRGTPLTDEQMLLLIDRAIAEFERQPKRPPHLTQAQAADMLGLSRATVGKLVRSGELRLNGVGRIPIGQIDMFLARTK
ncbi:helix-turn-helix domain-containing protein [Burkholderia cenocepacia]|uniref:helix-turn-helix domain-containing protein n=1 Tax=Burkholderia cenocepacia TaxID=95486 RepID=UPI0023B93863|nr:helix-turn-helix domain-containing protein [Burkholderia cenocepacia]MDF0500845.1 helix-turn-helix domain-containing protein [Burkholderia cenocepacia]